MPRVWKAERRCGETAVSFWASRVADRDGHWDLHSEPYMYCDICVNPTSDLMMLRYGISATAPGLLPAPEPRGRGGCWTRRHYPTWTVPCGQS